MSDETTEPVEEDPYVETVGCLQIDFMEDGTTQFRYNAYNSKNLPDFVNTMAQVTETVRKIDAALQP